MTAHWVQTGVHLAIYTAWAREWNEVLRHAPHMAAQIVFYYAFDLLLTWWRRDPARTGFGPIPIVGSVNLFLWFRDESFWLQFAVLAVGAVAKELVRWERAGRRTHVFNPSSFPLFFVCAGLWATGGDPLTWAGDIAVTQGLVPHAWLLVFGLALVVQSRFATTLVTLAAVVTLYVLNLVYTLATGVYCWVDVGIPVAIFIGCNFLVTDPATSPRTARGQAAFGALYGLSTFGLFLWLRSVGGPGYYDKLLFVPVLNLMVRRLDRLGGPAPSRRANLAWMAAASAVFAALFGTHFLGPGHPGKDLAFWEAACEQGRWHACASFAERLDSDCHRGEWEGCETFAKLLEAGVGVGRDRPDAGYHLALACQEGVASACARVPEFLASGGAEALAGACDAGDGLSCLVLGALGSGDEAGAPDAGRDRRARQRIARACELGVPEACEFLRRPLPAGRIPAAAVP